jgi:hypothetical protein
MTEYDYIVVGAHGRLVLAQAHGGAWDGLTSAGAGQIRADPP